MGHSGRLRFNGEIRPTVPFLRRGQRDKRTGELPPPSEQDFEALLVLDDLLTKLEIVDQRAAQGIQLTFFCGLSHAEAADVLGITTRTAERDWAFARAWLYDAMRRPGTGRSR